MTGFAERVVRLAAADLPEPQSSRHLEEWCADLAGANEAGVSRLGIAAGAVLFAFRSPGKSAASAARWSRWSLLAASIGSALWIALLASGLFWEPGFQNGGLVTAVVAGSVAIALGALAWRRSRISVWSTGATFVLLCLSAALWVVGPSDSPVFWVPVALAAAALLVVGMALMVRRQRRLNGLMVMVAATIPALVRVRMLLGPNQVWTFVALVPALCLLVLVQFLARRRSGSEQPS